VGENRNTIVFAAILMVFTVAAGAGIGLLRRPPMPAPLSDAMGTSPVPGTEAVAIEVHVAGWVNNPGVVTVGEDAIVADAIAAAGGMRSGANADGVNLAAALSAGQQVVVPGLGDSSGVGGASDAGGLVSLNRATESELESLPGVGPVLAGRIVSHRESHGPFEQVEDLLQVPGIGEAKLAALRDLVQP